MLLNRASRDLPFGEAIGWKDSTPSFKHKSLFPFRSVSTALILVGLAVYDYRLIVICLKGPTFSCCVSSQVFF